MIPFTSENSSILLIVDDIADNLHILSTSLTKEGYQVRCAKDGATTLLELFIYSLY